MVVLDDELSTINLGYHELGSNGQPMGKVLAKLVSTCRGTRRASPGRARAEFCRTRSSKCWSIPIWSARSITTDMSYQVEPGDIVMLPTQGYPIDNVLVSGWATPAYYRMNTDTRYDYGGYLTGPCPTQAHGTYLLQRKIGEQTWQPNVLYAMAEGPGLQASAAAALHDPPAPRVPPASYFARTPQVDTQHSRGARAITSPSSRPPPGRGATADTLILGLSVEPGKAGLLRREAALPEQVTPRVPVGIGG